MDSSNSIYHGSAHPKQIPNIFHKKKEIKSVRRIYFTAKNLIRLNWENDNENNDE